MITIRTLDGTEEISVENVRELIPYNGLFTSSQIRSSYSALLYYRDKILPVHGTLPKAWDANAPIEDRPWILICDTHARVIVGLPEFENEFLAENTSEDQKSA